MRKYLNNLRSLKLTKLEYYFLLMPIFVWFSYYPLMHFGQVAGANIEFSLIELYLVGFVILNAGNIFKNRHKLINNGAVQLVGAFVVFLSLSLFWTSNLIRGFLTVALVFVLFGSFLAILSTKRLDTLKPVLIRICFVSTLIMSVLAILQVVYGTWTDVALCSGCTAAGFGFVRPSVFTIEPQFFGSLLITPIMLLIGRFIYKKTNKFEIVVSFFAVVALYLTLSRGAIYAVAVAILVFMVLTHKQWRRHLQIVVIAVVSLFTGLMIDGIATQLNPRISDSFYDSASKSINQMSMGKILLPKIGQEEPGINRDKPDKTTGQPKAMFDGYVEKSTNERVTMTNLALQTWQKDSRTLFLGVGVGGSGKSIDDYTKKIGSLAEITQNQYTETILEGGLIGLAVFICIIFSLLFFVRKNRVCLVIIVAFLLQWNMFSGYPNALHVYLIMGIVYATIYKSYEKTPKY